MEWMLFLPFGFLCLRFGITCLNLLSSPLVSNRGTNRSAYLSILIPARNEAKNLPSLYHQLQNIKYSNFEIIILNDHSEDNTELLLKEYEQECPQLRYINGKALPEGWLGKNWACHQLSLEAKGEYFLFIDADVAEISPNLFAYTIYNAQDKGLALLSIFPRQQMHTLSEQAIVPLMHYLLLSLLPLYWIYHLPFPSMSAANGQFMLFNAKIYRKHQWHKAVKKVIVEDIAIMQKVKTQKLKGMTYLSGGLISCRMYQSHKEGIEGFSKNILAGFGNSIPGLLIYLVLILFAWPVLVYKLPLLMVYTSLAMIVLIRIFISILAKEPIGMNLLLHPLLMFYLVWISGLSIYKNITKQNIWKGRNVA